MQIRNSRSTSFDDLLSCRMAMLGLDLSAIESCGGQVHLLLQVFWSIPERVSHFILELSKPWFG